MYIWWKYHTTQITNAIVLWTNHHSFIHSFIHPIFLLTHSLFFAHAHFPSHKRALFPVTLHAYVHVSNIHIYPHVCDQDQQGDVTGENCLPDYYKMHQQWMIILNTKNLIEINEGWIHTFLAQAASFLLLTFISHFTNSCFSSVTSPA